MVLKIEANAEADARFLVIGLIADKHWSAVITYRGVNIRLISVRRSRIEEVAIYES
jgi:uncharacterized protein